MTEIDDMAENASAGFWPGSAGRTRVALITTPGRVGELLRRGVPGFQIEPIDGSELMAQRSLGLPVLSAFTGTDPELIARYRLSNIVLSPSLAAEQWLMAIGVRARRICRWEFAVDRSDFSPACYTGTAFPGAGDPSQVNLLYTGPLDASVEVDSLLESFRTAQRHDPRLQLITDPGTPEVLASADLLLVPGCSDLYGEAIVQAQASGLPVLAVQEGAALELIQSGRDGCLVPAGTFAFAEAIRWLARRATLRERLATGGLQAAQHRTWERSLEHLSTAWRAALSQDHGPAVRAA